MGMEMSVWRLVEVDIEADYGNMKVWNLEFPRLCEGLETLILNSWTLSLSLSLAHSVRPCKLKNNPKDIFQYQNIRSLHLLCASVAHVDGQLSVKVNVGPVGHFLLIYSHRSLCSSVNNQNKTNKTNITPASSLSVLDWPPHSYSWGGGWGWRSMQAAGERLPTPPKTSLMLMNAQRKLVNIHEAVAVTRAAK